MSSVSEPEKPPLNEPPAAEEAPAEDTAAVEESFEDLLAEYESQRATPASEGGVIKGTVVTVLDDGCFVDIGRKSEAFLPVPPVEDEKESPLAIGDAVDVTITGRSNDGYLTLSRVIAERPKDWTGLELAYERGTAIAGTVTEVVKGGLAVNVGVRAFLPASRSGTRDAEGLAALVGEEIKARIMQLDVADENVILDRRVLLEEEREQRRQETIASLEPGQTVKGTVAKIMDFGAFVDLGGVDGLLHINDLAWARVKDVSTVVSEGEELEVKVLSIEQGGKRISVGLKQLTPDPWTLIAEKLQQGDRIKGTVTRLMDFGAFVEIEPGVEGLVHVSEMSWARRVRHPSDLLKVGDVVDAVVLEVNAEKKRIGLGIKQALGDPWERVKETCPVGATVEGPVRNLAKFGAFVEVADGVEGLIHISDITAEKRLNHPSEVLKEGQTVKAVVLEIDPAKRRLKLGMKQLEPDDQDRFMEQCKAGDTLTGRVLRVKTKEAIIELGEGVKGICELPVASEAAKENSPAEQSATVSDMSAMLKAAWQGGAGGGSSREDDRLEPGQVRSFRITSLDTQKKTVKLALQ